jgi:hypothetical protein
MAASNFHWPVSAEDATARQEFTLTRNLLLKSRMTVVSALLN